MFSDVIPVDLAEADGDWPLAVIDTSDSFRDCHAYFYSLFRSEERSARSVQLTEVVIRQNSANYTAWYWRRKCLEMMHANDWADSEIAFVDAWALKSPKNYQVWFHRRWLVERLKDVVPDLLASELSYLDEVFRDDAKNYNAWSHRIFLRKIFGSPLQAELDFSERMILEDLKNNSAWSFRRQVFSDLGESLVSREIAFALETLELVPGNESAYSYLKSFPGWKEFPGLAKFFEGQNCRHALMAIFEMTEDKSVIEKLIETDPVREGYWRYRL